jgi:hypothetical protein
VVNKYIAELSLEGVLPPEFGASEKKTEREIDSLLLSAQLDFEILTTALLIVLCKLIKGHIF